MGQKMAQALKEYKVVDAKTFQIVLKDKFGAVIESLGKPSVVVPFMMPKAHRRDRSVQADRGVRRLRPVRVQEGRMEAGEKLVYTKFAKYKPRAEPMSGLSGGKVVNVDRVEWVWIPDAETQVNALLKRAESTCSKACPPTICRWSRRQGIRVIKGRVSNQYAFRPNWLQPPFNNEKVRQAAALALNQEDFLQANIGDKRFWQTCKAMFTCGSPLATDAGMAGLVEGKCAKAKALLAEAGYDGTPVTLLAPTDLGVIKQLGPVAKSLLRARGLQGRHDLDGLAKRDRPAAKKGPVLRGRLERFLHELVAGRHPRPR